MAVNKNYLTNLTIKYGATTVNTLWRNSKSNKIFFRLVGDVSSGTNLSININNVNNPKSIERLKYGLSSYSKLTLFSNYSKDKKEITS